MVVVHILIRPCWGRCHWEILCFPKHFVNISEQFSVPSLYFNSSSSASILPRSQCRQMSLCALTTVLMREPFHKKSRHRWCFCDQKKSDKEREMRHWKHATLQLLPSNHSNVPNTVHLVWQDMFVPHWERHVFLRTELAEQEAEEPAADSSFRSSPAKCIHVSVQVTQKCSDGLLRFLPSVLPVENRSGRDISSHHVDGGYPEILVIFNRRNLHIEPPHPHLLHYKTPIRAMPCFGE